ncbi:MAG TPA: hypothetical protein VGR01_19760 [Burkholderiales bacterium]|jgi:hypothetical protein|nr:hypothetical protein [Burkholderiales bacterium]
MNWANECTAAGIERFIPAGSEHPSAIDALRCIAEAREAATEAKQTWWMLEAVARAKDYQLFDDAVRGEKFTPGREPGSYGPIRQAMARLLTKNPGMKNSDLWNALAGNPPRGWTFQENRVGKYIEGPTAGEGMDLPRFRNIAWEERRKHKR